MKLTKAEVERIPFCVNGQEIYFDTEIKGFGLRVSRSKKSYFVQRAVNHRTVRTTIGPHGIFTAEAARKEAISSL